MFITNPQLVFTSSCIRTLISYFLGAHYCGCSTMVNTQKECVYSHENKQAHCGKQISRKAHSRPKCLEPLRYYTRQKGLYRSNGKIILDYNLDGPNLITWAPKAERCSRREVEHSLEGDSSCCPWREAHGKQEKECGWPLSEQRSDTG